jgi:hypothetical protein
MRNRDFAGEKFQLRRLADGKSRENRVRAARSPLQVPSMSRAGDWPAVAPSLRAERAATRAGRGMR